MTNQLELSEKKITITNTAFDFGALFVAVVSLSMAGILIRLSESEISPIATTFNRLWIATLVFGLWNGVNFTSNRLLDKPTDHQEPYTSGMIGQLVAAAAIASVSLLLLNWSLAHTTIANAIVLRNASALFTPLLGWLVLGQRYDGKFLIGIVVAIGGVIALGWKDLQIANTNLQGDTAVLLSAMFTSVFLLIVEQLRTKLTTTTILLWRCGIGTLFTLPIFLLAGDRFFPYSLVGWLAVIGQAVICQGLGQGLMVYSLKRLSSGFISLVVPLEIILAAIAGWVVFSEKISLFSGLAFSVILLGIYLATSSKSTVKPIETILEEV
jgi:drug/metabolite transporter (DMT)-like permease